ncbi:MAG TPA: TlpA disulfide reductase family protein, partial [Bacteroidales bacterium]|nr:TlpA disulfide reductase family protein [Bacteroidales bacterium]
LSNVTQDQASDYINQRKAIIREQRNFTIQFIIEHLNNLASIYAVYQTINPGQYVLGESRDIQYMKIVADSLSDKYPDVKLVDSFVDDARTTEQKFYSAVELQKKLNNASYGLPDLRIPNLKGDTIALSSLKGKTVLLYFWASSSRASREENLSLKKIYHNNKDKGFEIYAVSLDNDKTQWRQAVRYDELPWINVSELTFPNSRATAIYNVKKLPATFLLNSKGEVVARDIYGRELQKWLDNMLK